MGLAAGFQAWVLRVGILSLLVPAFASAAGLTPDAYNAAFDTLDSDAPAYVQVTITPETGPDWTGCVPVNLLIGAMRIQTGTAIPRETNLKLAETARKSDHFRFGPAAMANLPIYSEVDRQSAREWAAFDTNEQWLEQGRLGPVNVLQFGQTRQLPLAAKACALIERGITVETWDGRADNMFRVGWHLQR